jgi:nucleolar protein 56
MRGAVAAIVRTLLSTWQGCYLLENGKVVRSHPAPSDVEELVLRALARRSGALTPEESAILSEREGEIWSTPDRRLAEHGLRYEPGTAIGETPAGSGTDRESFRVALLRAAERSLAAAWDPSIHVEEAVRASSDLDRMRNLLGERVASWVARDHPDIDVSDPARAVRIALEPGGELSLAPSDPRLGEARRRLAELYRQVEAAQENLATAVASATPGRAPNLAHLLGADLAARLMAAAGGLQRLARLPASTIQVLGAERAFFEHLRGRAPPPRHGLLFLHPSIQSAPRLERGKLARALAGKTAIAARLDQAGSALDLSLARAYEARRAAVTARRGTPRKSRGRIQLRKPLDRATLDR